MENDCQTNELLNINDAFNLKMPGRVKRFVKHVGKCINEYQMICENDDVILGISGGKDSLVMSFALSLRLGWIGIKYNLIPVMINWIEHPIEKTKLDEIKNYFKSIKLELIVLNEEMYSQGFKGDFNCYLCSRNRRRILFDYAKTKGIKKIALGHHLDDIVETAIINTAFRGHFESMAPVQDFFGGDLKIIRPLSFIHERHIKRIADDYSMPYTKPVCPHEKENIRIHIKPIVASLAHINPLSREHIFHSLAEKDCLGNEKSTN